MKLTAKKRISTVFAIVLFALACPTNAMPPVPRTLKGGVERIDAHERELVITNRHERKVLAWRESAPPHIHRLKPGDAVKGYYRKEAGRYVITGLRVPGPTCCK